MDGNTIENGYCPFFLPGIQMRICIPGDLHIGMAKPPGDLLNIDPFIGKQAGVAVPVIVDPDWIQASSFRPLDIVV